jgi:hypothetical protein
MKKESSKAIDHSVDDDRKDDAHVLPYEEDEWEEWYDEGVLENQEVKQRKSNKRKPER